MNYMIWLMLLTSGLTKYINITGENYHPKVCTITHSYFVLLNGNPNHQHQQHCRPQTER